MRRSSVIKSFGMTNMLLEADLDSIEDKYQLDLGRRNQVGNKIEDKYYPQFDSALRAEAKKMSAHYELFYCLEKSIRQLIVDVFEGSGDKEWWENQVPEIVKANAKKSIKREKESAVTPRSADSIDYTTFGELGEIIKSNWSLFGGVVFNDLKAMEKVMSALNSLRNPIAHCSPLAEDEELRLELALRDWFRLVS
ncbi:Swt1 family HEPN domain-containing protein [Agarivorans sp. 1_MG-2023]|uniref:Swt1 family HEPN domain-containing protein n=1 Tax=Agarivorans sp. 1_MG-2023 TaxID=3062634 RepID=UPI0026E23F23|nr:Swt1 family HEPN domain-containing protein [Agarivorans sp. 1_MG-2023]MDO6765144.1 Swt1 family HEPN domain-containing protein [Agarivorans sp. 1_MG-2023]